VTDPFPPEYPYGGPGPADPSLLREPGGHPPRADPPPGRAAPGYPPPGYPPLGYPPPGPAMPAYAVPGVPPQPGTLGYLPVPAEYAAARANAVAALVVSVLLLFPCFDPLALPAVVLAAIAVRRARTDVAAARTLTRAAWGFVALGVAAAVAFVVWSVASGPAPVRTPSPSASSAV